MFSLFHKLGKPAVRISLCWSRCAVHICRLLDSGGRCSWRRNSVNSWCTPRKDGTYNRKKRVFYFGYKGILQVYIPLSSLFVMHITISCLKMLNWLCWSQFCSAEILIGGAKGPPDKVSLQKLKIYWIIIFSPTQKH